MEKNKVKIEIEGFSCEIAEDVYNSTAVFQNLIILTDEDATTAEKAVALEKIIKAMLGAQQMKAFVAAFPDRDAYLVARNEIMAKFNEVKKK